MIKEEELTSEKLLDAIRYVDENREQYRASMAASSQQDAVIKVADVIDASALS